MRFLTFFIFLIISGQANADTAWQWHNACSPDDENIQCTVWFDHQNQYDDITVKIDSQELPLEMQSFAQYESISANAVLFHLGEFTEDQLDVLKGSLNLLVDTKDSFQQLGLYASSEGLQILAPLAVENNQLKMAISNLGLPENIENPARDLDSVMSILGGSGAERKVVYWVTTGVSLSEGQIEQIQLKLAQEKIRLVILHLALFEHLINASLELALLGNSVIGHYSLLRDDTWETSIENLLNYSNNGAQLSINSQALCGSTELGFSVTLGDMVENTSVSITLEDCGVATIEGTELEGTVLEETVPEETVPEETVPEETVLEEVVPEETVPEETVPEETVLEETVPEAGSDEISDVAKISGAILVVVLLLLVILVIKNRRKKSNTAPLGNDLTVLEEGLQKATYGYLVVIDPQGERQIPLVKVSSKIGRSSDNDIVFEDDTVSGHHALVKCERSGYITLIDLNSLNGTRVNGKKIHQQKLELGDEIELGNYKLRFGG